MKTLHLVILGSSIAMIVIVFFYEFSLYFDKYQESCATTMIVIYAEPTKYNQTLILNALRDNLSKDNFRDYHGPEPWWQSVIIDTTDKHVVNLLIPSIDGKTINMTKTIISKIDGVGNILPSETQCIRAQ